MILFFGRSGQLAQSFRATLPEHLEGQTLFVSSQEANFEKPQTLAGFLDKYSPEIVVICAAYTQVDKAEEERQLAETINFRAPQAIARWCEQNDALLIHFSTDYVYSGDGTAAWTESSPTAPTNWYGETKLEGDEAIQSTGCRHFIFRTAWVFSEFGKNFLKTMLRIGEKKTTLRVVNDQFGSPTYAIEIAKTVWSLIGRWRQGEKFPSGVYHLAGQGWTNWASFSEAIFAEAKALRYELDVETVEGIPSSDYPTPAHRPLNSRLDQSKLKQVFGVELPAWRDSVQLCLKRMRS